MSALVHEGELARRWSRVEPDGASVPMSVQTLRRWVREGRLNDIKIGRQRFFAVTEIERIEREGMSS